MVIPKLFSDLSVNTSTPTRPNYVITLKNLNISIKL